MDVIVEQHTTTTSIVRISGSVDGLTADTLQSMLRDTVEAGSPRLVGDMSGVEYTSSAGLRALLATLKLTRQRGGDFRLAGVQPNVLKVLDLSGFTSILKLYPSVDAAIASFGA